jgi:hypothetical protein
VVAVGQRIPNTFLFSIEGGNNPSTINEIFSFVNSSEIKKEEFLDEIEIPVEVFEMVFNQKLLSDSLANTIISKLKSDRERKIEQRDSILYSDDLESIKKFLEVSI